MQGKVSKIHNLRGNYGIRSYSWSTFISPRRRLNKFVRLECEIKLPVAQPQVCFVNAELLQWLIASNWVQSWLISASLPFSLPQIRSNARGEHVSQFWNRRFLFFSFFSPFILGQENGCTDSEFRIFIRDYTFYVQVVLSGISYKASVTNGKQSSKDFNQFYRTDEFKKILNKFTCCTRFLSSRFRMVA